jgi:hypothetical protein
MFFERVINPLSAPAVRDLSSYQNYAVKLNTDGEIDYYDSSAAAAHMCGVLVNKPAAEAGAECEMARIGDIVLMVVNGAAGAIAIGTPIGSNSEYKGIAVSGDDAFYFATALAASTTDEDLIPVEICGPSYISGSGDD